MVGNGISESSTVTPNRFPLLKVLPPPGVPPSPVATPAIPRWFVDRVSPRGKPRGKTLSSVSVLKGHQHININQKTCFLKDIIHVDILSCFVRCCCVNLFCLLAFRRLMWWLDSDFWRLLSLEPASWAPCVSLHRWFGKSLSPHWNRGDLKHALNMLCWYLELQFSRSFGYFSNIWI